MQRFLSCLLFMPLYSSAAPQIYERSYHYDSSENESPNQARDAAQARVIANLISEIGTYVEQRLDIRETGEGRIWQQQQIHSLTAGTVSYRVLEESFNDGDYQVRALLTADPDEVVDKVNEAARLRRAQQETQRKLQLEQSQTRQQMAQLNQQLGTISLQLETMQASMQLMQHQPLQSASAKPPTSPPDTTADSPAEAVTPTNLDALSMSKLVGVLNQQQLKSAPVIETTPDGLTNVVRHIVLEPPTVPATVAATNTPLLPGRLRVTNFSDRGTVIRLRRANSEQLVGTYFIPPQREIILSQNNTATIVNRFWTLQTGADIQPLRQIEAVGEYDANQRLWSVEID